MKKRLFFIFFLFLLASPFLTLNVKADTTNPALDGLNQTANVVGAFKGQTGDSAVKSKSFLQTEIGTIVGVVLSFVGILSLILIIYAGIKWMMSNGNKEEVNKAKNLIINSIIGIVIVFAAYAITSFIGSEILK